MSWEMISKENLFNGDYTHVENWRMNNHKDSEEDYEIITYPDAVFVFVLTKSDQVLILDQYSVAAQDHTNQLVSGYVEAGEDPKMAAERELKEETGYISENFEKLGSTNRSTWATGDYHFFLASDARREGDQRLDSSEDIKVELISFSKLKHILDNSDLHAAGSVACAYKALSYLGKI